jgi:hypothetical protein
MHTSGMQKVLGVDFEKGRKRDTVITEKDKFQHKQLGPFEAPSVDILLMSIAVTIEIREDFRFYESPSLSDCRFHALCPNQ